MKLLTTNFLTCAVKTCKTSPLSFPLHFRDATLARTELAFNPAFLSNILPRINWAALTTTAAELGLGAMVPARNPADEHSDDDDEIHHQEDPHDDVDEEMKEAGQPERKDEEGVVGDGVKVPKEKVSEEEVLRKLHTLLLETGVVEGKLVCGNCGFEYPIKEGVGNFLLPAHLV